MAPRHISGTLWELLDGEFVEGPGGRIDGPYPVRIQEFEHRGRRFYSVQGKERKVQVEGPDFESTVQREKQR